jgi:hypothetical protein
MPLLNLHILHPPESRIPGISAWMAEVQTLVSNDAKWDGCKIRRSEYDSQGSFIVATEGDLIRRNPGPVVVIQKIQAKLREKLVAMLPRDICVYHVPVTCAEDFWQAIETARAAYEDGEPKIPLREAIAYLILKKLERHDYWGGGSANKAFLWTANLPKGGFPHDIVDQQMVLAVAIELERVGLLQSKNSCGQRKIALGQKSVVQPILDQKSFRVLLPDVHRKLVKFFEGDNQRVSIRVLDFK